MKKKGGGTIKPRREFYQWTTSGDVSELRFTFDELTGAIEAPDADPATILSVVSYERTSGKDKVLLSVPGSPVLPAFDSWQQIMGQVSYLLAIDTNTRNIGGKSISITFASRLTKRLPTADTKFCFLPVCAYATVGVSPEVNPECIGWHLVFQNHLALQHLSLAERVGVVVDSELGRIPSINARREPYYDGHLLPEKVLMLYASDASSDSVPTAMIRYCDSGAEGILNHIEERGVVFPPPRACADANFISCHQLEFNVRPPSAK